MPGTSKRKWSHISNLGNWAHKKRRTGKRADSKTSDKENTREEKV